MISMGGISLTAAFAMVVPTGQGGASEASTPAYKKASLDGDTMTPEIAERRAAVEDRPATPLRLHCVAQNYAWGRLPQNSEVRTCSVALRAAVAIERA